MRGVEDARRERGVWENVNAEALAKSVMAAIVPAGIFMDVSNCWTS